MGLKAGRASPAHNKRLAPPRPAAAPENPPRPCGSWKIFCGFEGDRAMEAAVRRVANLERYQAWA